MASLATGIIGGLTGLGGIASGLLTSASDKSAANHLLTAATAASTAVGTAGNQAAAATNTATGQATTGINNAVGTGQTGINNAVTSGTAGVNAGTLAANTLLGSAGSAQTSNINPYLQTGQAGTTAYNNLLQQGFQAPTAAQAAATPGEQFQMQQGAQLLQQQAAAEGGVDTGGELQALTQYGQNVASTYYQNAFNNALQSYQTNLGAAQGAVNTGLTGSQLYNQAVQNQTNQQAANTSQAAYYGSNLGYQGATTNAQLGLSGATTAGQLGLSGAETAGNQNMQGTDLASQYYMNGATDWAALNLGSTQALASGIGAGITGAIPGLSSLFGTSPTSSGASLISPSSGIYGSNPYLGATTGGMML